MVDRRDKGLAGLQFGLMLFSLVVVALAAVAVISVTQSDCTGAEQFETDGLTYEIHDDYVTVVASEDRASVTVPSTVTHGGSTYTVDSIGQLAFFKCTSMTSISLPDTIEKINHRAFMGCRSLTSITIPKSTDVISSDAFMGCMNLKSFQVSSENSHHTSIDGILYSKDGRHLEKYPLGRTDGEFVIADEVMYIDDLAFAENIHIRTITMKYVVTLGQGAFSGCINLSSVNLDTRLTGIGKEAFMLCKSLGSIDIPRSVSMIQDSAFNGCNSLSSVNVDSGNNFYSSLDGVLFNHDKTILILYPAMKTDTEDYTIISGVEELSLYSFVNNKKLVSVTIPASVKTIHSYFLGCTSLNAINVDSGNKTYSSIGGVLYSNDTTTLIRCPAAKEADVFEVPEGVTTIGPSSFFKCYNIKSIHFSKTVQYIRPMALFGCSLESYDVDKDNDYLCSEGGVLYSKDMTVLYSYPSYKTDFSFTLPESVKTIGVLGDIIASCGLSNNRFLVHISVGESPVYKSVDGMIYSKDGSSLLVCPGGKVNVTVAEGTSTISRGAFINSSVQSLELPDNITVGTSALINCSSLGYMKIGGNGVVFENLSLDFLDLGERHSIKVDAPEGYVIPATAIVGNVELTYNVPSSDSTWILVLLTLIAIVAILAIVYGYRKQKA